MKEVKLYYFGCEKVTVRSDNRNKSNSKEFISSLKVKKFY